MQAINTLDEKSKLERAWRDLQLDWGNLKYFIDTQDLSGKHNCHFKDWLSEDTWDRKSQVSGGESSDSQASPTPNSAAAKHGWKGIREEIPTNSNL